MSDLDNTSESIARFEFSFPLAAPRAEPRECEGRLFPAVTEQLLFEMSLLCGLRGCAGLPYKRDETWQMNHTACARLGARAVQVPGAFQKENGRFRCWPRTWYTVRVPGIFGCFLVLGGSFMFASDDKVISAELACICIN
jgi:hypothetical protein